MKITVFENVERNSVITMVKTKVGYVIKTDNYDEDGCETQSLHLSTESFKRIIANFNELEKECEQ